MNNTNLVNIRLSLSENLAPKFFQLLSMGFHLSIHEKMTLKDLLCDRLGVKPDYLKERIQTIFLNGKAVDNEGDLKVQPGDVLALSAAMPGLAGAMMRKQGRYAPMRKKISHESSDAQELPEPAGEVAIKLFNIIAHELGPVLFEQGVVVKGNAFQSMVRREPEEFKEGCLSVAIDDEAVSVEDLLKTDFSEKTACIQMESNSPE